jgi:phosphoglycolate phosphatase
MPPLRCAYLDLDGTLLGRDGSLFHDAAGDFTLLGARALEACDRAGTEVVIVSGRRHATVLADARMLGARAWAFEAGCGLVLDGELEWLTDGLEPRDGATIFDLIARTGAPDLLLEHYAGRLEYHAPWHLHRDVSHLFRGEVDAEEADALLLGHGHDALRLVDNGGIGPPSATLPAVERPRAYHLIPRGASKARAAARHQRARGYAPEECIAVGDSREDLGLAAVVGSYWVVANALERDPSIRDDLAAVANVRVSEERNGPGVYEAVITELAERR